MLGLFCVCWKEKAVLSRSFIKVKCFFIHFVLHVRLSFWLDVMTVEGGFSLTELSVFCCFLFPDWCCSSVCANLEADSSATVATCWAPPGPVTVQCFTPLAAAPAVHKADAVGPLYICPENLLVPNCELNQLSCPLPYLMCRSVKTDRNLRK